LGKRPVGPSGGLFELMGEAVKVGSTLLHAGSNVGDFVGGKLV
jgi:hypothetical protein